MALAHGVDVGGPRKRLIGCGTVVVPCAGLGPGQHAAVEHPRSQVGHPLPGAGVDQIRGGPVEQGVAARHQHAVQVGPLQEHSRGGHRVGPQRDRSDRALVPQCHQRRVGALQRFMDVVVGVMDVHDVDPVHAETLQARLHRLHRRVVSEIEVDVDRAVGTVRQQAASLGGDDRTLAARRGQRLAQPLLGLAQPVEGGGVEEPDASLEGTGRSLHRGVGVVAPEDGGQRGSPHRQPSNLKTGPSQVNLFQRILHGACLIVSKSCGCLST